MSVNNQKIYFIEGNVGVGKSTLLKKLQESKYLESNNKDKKIAYIFEPVDYWINYKDNNDENILSHFYKNQEKFGFSFQWLVFMSRLKEINECLKKDYDIIIVERSIFTDKNVFMKSLYQKNKVTDIEYKIYNDWFSWIFNQFELPQFKFIYLKLSTELCADRIRNRNRDAEKDIDIEYLRCLNDNHNEWLSALEKNECLTLDGTYDNSNIEELNIIYKNINNFINQ